MMLKQNLLLIQSQMRVHLIKLRLHLISQMKKWSQRQLLKKVHSQVSLKQQMKNNLLKSLSKMRMNGLDET
jgi:hypothetical protein